MSEDKKDIIKNIIEEVVKRKLNNNLISKENLIKKYNFGYTNFNLEKNKDVKELFRYIEINNAVPTSIDMIYKTLVSKNFNKCSGYDILIDPLGNIIITFSKYKYENILKNSTKINNFINNYNGTEMLTVTEEYEDIEKYVQLIFRYYKDTNEQEYDDEYKEKILRVIADILTEIFNLCDESLIPLQVQLTVYSYKNLKRGIDEIEGYHRTFIVFIKEQGSLNREFTYKGYYYDPEGYKEGYTDTIYKIIQNIKYKNLSITTFHESCPIGIQKLLKDSDIGLCTIYSHFWYHCFLEVLYIIKKYEIEDKIILEINNIEEYVKYLNKCIIEIPYKMNLDNKTIINIYINYAIYIIGYTYNLYTDKEKIIFKEYINKVMNS